MSTDVVETPAEDLANMSLEQEATSETNLEAKKDEPTSGEGATEVKDGSAGDRQDEDTAMKAADGDEESNTEGESNRNEPDDLTKALNLIAKSKESLAKSCVSALGKHLRNLKKKPNETRYRKMRMDNIIVKKFITGVPGAQDFMQACGFKEVQEGAKKYLAIDPATIDNEVLDNALDLLSGKKETFAKPLEKKEEATRVKCAGGCGFWGDSNTDNYCSQCVRKRVIGGPTSAAASNAPKKCIKECGFFGADKFNGMCSVCWGKESKENAKTWKAKLKKAMLKIKCMRAFRSAPRLKQKHKNRCWQCKRKIGIVGIQCRCGYIFCGKHRYAQEHNCTFDHRQHQQKKLRKENKQILTKKLDKLED